MKELLEKKALQHRADYEKFNPCPAIDELGAQAIAVWNALGGEIDYAALPWLIEQYGIPDSAALQSALLVIRDTLQEVRQ